MLKHLLSASVATTLLAQIALAQPETRPVGGSSNAGAVVEASDSTATSTLKAEVTPEGTEVEPVTEAVQDPAIASTTSAVAPKRVVHRSVITPKDAKYAKQESGFSADDESKVVARPGEPQQSIEQVMAKAYSYNKRLQSERENVKVTDENVSESVSEWLPTVTASGSRGKQMSDRRGSIGVDKSNDISNTKSLNLSLPLFDGFGSYNRFKREKSNVEASKARLKSIEQEVLLNSAIAYMNVVRERESLQLNRSKEQDLRGHYNDTQSRFDLGEITQTDVSQSYTRLTRSITERMDAEALYEASKASYQRIVGEEPMGLYLDVADPLTSEEMDKDKLVAQALANNPEINVAKLNKEAASYDVKNKRAALLPSVSLTAGKNWRSGGYLGSGIDETHEREVMFNVRVPIYQAGAEYSRIRRAKLTEAKLRYDMEDRQDSIREDVIRALHDYKVAVSSIEVHEANARTAESALAGLKHEVQVGVRTTIDMLDAEQELYEARLLLLRAKRDKIVNAYTLLERLGRLTAEDMHLAVKYHNPDAYYNKMQYRLIGY